MEENRIIPAHVSIIMDGNGRWAKQRGLERVSGHKEGRESVRACVSCAAKAGIKYLSLFAFSEENWKRPLKEVTALMNLLVESITAELGTFIENNIRVRVIGNIARLSPVVRSAISKAEENTAACTGMTLVIFLSYSGKWDIFQAARKMAADMAADPGREFTMEDFDNYLATAGIPDPDLIIRTSGEQRISNYLLWQAAYSEFYITDILWPDFREKELMDAIDEYSRRDRRYGKVK
jgi:undecaprenyl diphosphate synthase